MEPVINGCCTTTSSQSCQNNFLKPCKPIHIAVFLIPPPPSSNTTDHHTFGVRRSEHRLIPHRAYELWYTLWSTYATDSRGFIGWDFTTNLLTTSPGERYCVNVQVGLGVTDHEWIRWWRKWPSTVKPLYYQPRDMSFILVLYSSCPRLSSLK
jgi:hypothetical protein